MTNLSCHLCQEPCADQAAIRTHFEEVHQSLLERTCKQCGLTLSTKSQLDDHVNAKHGVVTPVGKRQKSQPQCEVCDKTFSTLFNRNRHREQVHNQNRQSTKQAEKAHTPQVDGDDQVLESVQANLEEPIAILESNEDMEVTKESSVLTVKHSCDQCGKTFLSKRSQRRHMKMTHSDLRPFPCRFCDKRFKTLQNSKYHENSFHLGSRPYPCGQCDKAFNRKDALKRHEKRFHLPGEQDLAREEVILDHTLVRVEKKPVVIDFRNLSDIKKHFADNSSGEEDTDQDQADKSLDQKLMPDTDRQCKICGKIFSSSTALRGHVKQVHEKERPYSCYNLNRHNKSVAHQIHPVLENGQPMKEQKRKVMEDSSILTDSRDISFDNVGEVQSDVKPKPPVHAKPKSFRCDICNKILADRHTMKNHIERIHRRAFEFECQECGKKFNLKKQLSAHVRSVHA